MKRIWIYGPLAAGLALAACAPREVILPGQRYDVRLPDELTQGDALPPAAENQSRAIALPAARTLTAWPGRGTGPLHAIPPLALSAAPQLLWEAPIGQGNDRRHRITATPVAENGTIYTLDSRSTVTATSGAGAALWSVSLIDRGDSPDDASGGGLALGDGKLFVTTGFGTVEALDPATGATLWSQTLGASAGASPTVSGKILYLVDHSARGWAISTTTGKLLWQISGVPTPAGYVGGAGVAVDGRLAVFPFDSGEVTAVLKLSGIRTWGGSVSGQRRGAAYGAIGDIGGDPVLSGGRVYVSNAAGAIVALDAANGDEIWTAEEGARSSVIVAGGSVFLVSDANRLVRLDARDGSRIWAVNLPNYTTAKERKRTGVHAHFGPLIAGGRVLVASDDGLIRQFDPVSGDLLGTVSLPAGASSDPIVVGGTLYVVTSRGTLAAFR